MLENKGQRIYVNIGIAWRGTQPIPESIVSIVADWLKIAF